MGTHGPDGVQEPCCRGRQGETAGIVTLGDIAEAYLASSGALRGKAFEISGSLDGDLVVEAKPEFRGVVEVTSHGGVGIGEYGGSRLGAQAGSEMGVLLIVGRGYIGPEVLETPGLEVIVPSRRKRRSFRTPR